MGWIGLGLGPVARRSAGAGGLSIDPTGPTDPTTPTEPTGPTLPTEPTLPTDPTTPTDPTGPTEPVPLPFGRVSADGWTVEAADPIAALGRAFTLSRAGFDASGAAVRHSEQTRVTARLRLPYPGQDTPSPDRLALADFVYQGDQIPGAENDSLRPAPLPIAAWLQPDREIVSTPHYTARLAVAHAHGREGRPVAAVKFTLSDGATSVEVLVSAMATLTYPVSGLSVPHFKADLPLAGFADGATLSLDAVIYPWVGAAFLISRDADPYPSPNLTTLRLLCNRGGTFGTGYAYVDATSGTAGGVASALPATAEAAPFQNVVQAATALRAFNNAQFGRNFTDGGVIRLVEGVHSLASAIRAVGVTSAWPLTIEAADPAKRATTLFQDRGTTLPGSLPNHLRLRNLTLRRGAAGSVVFLDQAAANLTYDSLLQIEDCHFEDGGFGEYVAWVYKCSRVQLLGCSGRLGLACGASAPSANKTVQLIGSDSGPEGLESGALYAVCGSRLKAEKFGLVQPGAAVSPGQGHFYGWNMIRSNATTYAVLRVSAKIGPRGLALVGSVAELYGASTQPVLQISADGVIETAENLVLQLNTLVGERTNLLYNDTGADVTKSGHVLGNVFRKLNIKSDLFSAAPVTGNWPARFKVGFAHNAILSGATDGKGYGPSGWIGEQATPGERIGTEAAPLAAAWTQDASRDGTGLGGGDYTPGPGHALPLLPGARVPYPCDLLGRAIPLDGQALAGAQQRP